MPTEFSNLQLFRVYITKSKAGHYTATARHLLHGGLIKKTVLKHGSIYEAKRELSELLDRTVAI